MIRAAGGVVVSNGTVLLVHRPMYDDWTFPKGKCQPRETDEECALREVEEETGLRCEIERPLGETRYSVPAGPKVVHYFVMRPVDGAFRSHDEVDKVEWVPVEGATSRLSFEHDARLLDEL